MNDDSVFFDYDNCRFNIVRTEKEPDTLKLGFSCNAFKQIMENGGQEMLDELYKGQVIENLEGSDITLGIDVSNIPKTESK
jgi:hypothetical protein